MINWPIAKLGDIFEIARGGSPRPIQQYLTDDPNGVNWIMIGDATSSSKYINETKKRIKPEGVKRSRMVQPGDFVLTNSMSFGHPYIMGTSGCIHDGWLVLSPRLKNFHSDFFYHLLGSPTVYHQFEGLAGGAVVKNLNIQLVSGVEVPVPDLAEQKRIAAILDKADAIRRKRQQALALTDDLLRSTFLDMFGDPVTNPKGWPVEPVGQHIKEITAGKSIGGESRSRNSEEWGVLKISAVTSGRFLPEEYKVVSANLPDVPVVPKKGDLLFSRANTRELVAATCLVPTDCDRLFLPDKLWRIETQPKSMTKEYLRFALADAGFRNRVTTLATGTSGSMLNVSQAKLKAVELPIPQLSLQQDFSRFVWRHFEYLHQCEKNNRSADSLFNSCLQQAFRGDL